MNSMHKKPGAALKRCRMGAGHLTQVAISERTGIEQYNISRAENGDPRLSQFIELAAACGYQVRVVYVGYGQASANFVEVEH